uniref:Uncharacterized protein n=1 Tax=Rhizophora mucronata TaxID=61149 RepID=A0A2P2QPX5_RHIMU
MAEATRPHDQPMQALLFSEFL